METLATIFSGESGWGWLVLGALLFALEVLVPGFYLAWFGVAGFCVGGLLFLVPLENPWPLASFCGFSLLSVLIGRALWGSHRQLRTDNPLLNQRGRQLIGQTLILADPIEGGRGRAKVGDTLWTVTGPNLPAGHLVRVKDAEGTILTVEDAGEQSPRFPKAGSFST
jgi:hypothetical protein